jgi:hypothetical protein
MRAEELLQQRVYKITGQRAVTLKKGRNDGTVLQGIQGVREFETYIRRRFFTTGFRKSKYPPPPLIPIIIMIIFNIN